MEPNTLLQINRQIPPVQDITEKLSPMSTPIQTTNQGWKYFIIFLILAVLGLNVFGYLGDITEKAGELIRPLLSKIASIFGFTLRQTAETTAEGAKIGAQAIGGAVTGAVKGATGQFHPKDELKEYERHVKQRQENVKPTYSDEVPKQGFCYIGTDRGYRSCIHVDQSTKCLSGEIFPTRSICVNPTLRQ